MKLMTRQQTHEHRARARMRELRGEKLAPVGEHGDWNVLKGPACPGCGYHVCSCVRRDPVEGRAFFSPRAYNDYTEIHAHYALAAVSTVDYATKPDETAWVVHTPPGMSQARRMELLRDLERTTNAHVPILTDTQQSLATVTDCYGHVLIVGNAAGGEPLAYTWLREFGPVSTGDA